MDESPILVEPRANYRVVTLNRPQRLNAFTEAMHRALMAALNEASTGAASDDEAPNLRSAHDSRPLQLLTKASAM